MDNIVNVFDFFLQIPVEVWGLLLGATVVSTVTQVLKGLLKMENDKIIMFLFVSMSFAASGLDYLINQAMLPPTILGFNTALIIGVATPVYRFFVKPATSFLRDVRAYRGRLVEHLDEIEAVNKVADLPGATVVEKGDDAAIIAPIDTILEDELREEPKKAYADF